MNLYCTVLNPFCLQFIRFAQQLFLRTTMKKSIHQNDKIPSKSPSFSKTTSLTFPKSQLAFDIDLIKSRRWSQLQLVGKNNEQLDTIQNFVQQIASDPTILFGLANYEQLIFEIRQQNEQIQSEIQRRKEQIKIYNKKHQEKFGNNSASYSSIIKQSYKEVQQQIKRFQVSLNELRRQKQLANEKRLNEQKKLNDDIRQAKQKAKNQIKRIQCEIKAKLADEVQNMEKVQNIENSIGKLKQKWDGNKVKSLQILNATNQLRKQKQMIIMLKNKQNEELQKHRQTVMKKRNNEQQLKRVSEKKLLNFSTELQKKIRTGDISAFQKFYILHEVKKTSTKRLSMTTDTRSDDNSQSEEQGIDKQSLKQLEQMEIQNPTLKDNRKMNIKSIEPSNFRFQIDLQKEKKERFQYEAKKQQFQTKIKSLTNQQEDVDGFLSSLRDKVLKIQSQLNESKATGRSKK